MDNVKRNYETYMDYYCDALYDKRKPASLLLLPLGSYSFANSTCGIGGMPQTDLENLKTLEWWC